MNHKSTRVYNQSWTNEHHRAQSTNRGSEDRPVNVTVVNKVPGDQGFRGVQGR